MAGKTAKLSISSVAKVTHVKLQSPPVAMVTHSLVLGA